MEPKNVTKWMMVAVLAITLTACGKKKNGTSDTAAAPAAPTTTATCTYNNTSHAWLDQNGAACVPSNNTITCTWNSTANQWLNQQGQTCTPTNGSGPCDYWTNYYHVYYVPIQVPVSTTFPHGIACFNINYLNSYLYNTDYEDNYDYWNYDTPHTCHGSSCGGGNTSCNTRISLNFSLWNNSFGVGTDLCLK